MQVKSLIAELGTSQTLVPAKAEGLESLKTILGLPKDDFKQIIARHSIFVPTFSTVRYEIENFRNRTTDGFPILEIRNWLEKEDFFNTEIDSAEPCIITRALVENSTGESVLGCQLRNLQHIKKNLPLHLFSEKFMRTLVNAEVELLDLRKVLEELINEEKKEGLEKIWDLKAFKLTMPSLPLLLQFMIKMESQTGDRLLNYSSAFTSSIGMGNAIIYVGNFDLEGAEIMGLLLKGKLPNTGSVVRLRLRDLFE